MSELSLFAKAARSTRRKEWKVFFVVQFSLLLWNYFVSFLVCFLVQRISKKLHAYIGDTVIS